MRANGQWGSKAAWSGVLTNSKWNTQFHSVFFWGGETTFNIKPERTTQTFNIKPEKWPNSCGCREVSVGVASTYNSLFFKFTTWRKCKDQPSKTSFTEMCKDKFVEFGLQMHLKGLWNESLLVALRPLALMIHLVCPGWRHDALKSIQRCSTSTKTSEVWSCFPLSQIGSKVFCDSQRGLEGQFDLSWVFVFGRGNILGIIHFGNYFFSMVSISGGDVSGGRGLSLQRR